MTLRQLEIFIAVANFLNFREAAAELRISQPGISRQLRRFQLEIGKPLYRKVSHGIELTPVGVGVFKEAKEILAKVASLKREFRNEAAKFGAATLIVGGTYSPSARLLPLLMASFKKRFPDVNLELRTGRTHRIEQMALDGKVELAVVQVPPSSDKLAAEICGYDQLVPFVSVKHPLARRKELTMTDIEKFGFVVRSWGRDVAVPKRLFESMAKKGWRFREALRCDSTDAVKAAVAKRMGIGLLFRDVIAGDVKKGIFREVPFAGEKWGSTRYVIFRKDRPLSQCAVNFLDFLRAHYRQRVKRQAIKATRAAIAHDAARNASSRLG